ncbi:hypothetical protein PGB90_001804 [Kerria lacca]
MVDGEFATREPVESNGLKRRSQFLKRCEYRRGDSEPSVDDLGTGQGVVLGRAVTTLRSVKTALRSGPFGVESGGGDDSDDDANHLYDGVLPLLPGRYRDFDDDDDDDDALLSVGGCGKEILREKN